MKKTISTIAIIVFSIAMFIVSVYLLLHFFGSNFFILYTSHANFDGFWIGINKISDCAYVGEYDCINLSPGENRTITIPDTYHGIPVTNIGGYYGTHAPPHPFTIYLSDSAISVPEGSTFDGITGSFSFAHIEETYTVENIVFDLYIGKNIRHIESISMDWYYSYLNEDSSLTFYHPVVRVHCSEENQHFYSLDGKLYNKETRELISDFEYATP